MKTNKLRLRKCIVCREEFPQKDLLRVVRQKDGTVSIDHDGKINGRGAYFCKDKQTIEKIIDKKLLNRHLKVNVPDEIYKELESM